MSQDSKKIGTSAKELVLLFYDKTGLKFTNKDIMIAIKNAKNLLNVGYTYDEIKDTIEYCVANPPEKGIYSFGFIVYEINKVLALLKAKNKTLLLLGIIFSALTIVVDFPLPATASTTALPLPFKM